MSNDTTPISIARGDGIGPEIMDATLRILEAADARLDITEIEAGREVYERGVSSGIAPGAWDQLRETRVLLKSPITTPQGGGYKSLNVTIRKSLSLYANVRPCVAYDPVVPTSAPGMDVTVVRENEEDSYSGIEYRQTGEVEAALKFISQPGTERLVRFAFEYAEEHDRDLVTCMTKDNILKRTDGLFHEVFEEVAEDYPDIDHDHRIVDIGMAEVAVHPNEFDVVVAPNLYGDIISDITAELTGSVGLCGSGNIGDEFAMFEALHGSAPDIAGEGIANPSGLLHGAVLMLNHIGQNEVATRVRNAWLTTLEDGYHTPDVYDESRSEQLVDTDEFADAVIDRLGRDPTQFEPVDYPDTDSPEYSDSAFRIPPEREETKELVGVDAFLEWRGGTPDELGDALQALETDGLELNVITNRGMKVWPDGLPETFVSDHWQCRFETTNGPIEVGEVLDLLKAIDEAGFDLIKTEHLYNFDGEPGYTRGQGE
jgi:isocitrate dehydrogenase